MRSQLAICCLLLYLVALVHPAAPYLEYALNQAYIAANLCENQDRPEMKCNGHCYLMKKVAAQSQEDGGSEPVLLDAEKIPLAFPSDQPNWNSPTETETGDLHLPSLLSDKFETDIFHPPIV